MSSRQGYLRSNSHHYTIFLFLKMVAHIDVLFPTLFRVLSDASDEVIIKKLIFFFAFSIMKVSYFTDKHLSY